MNWEIYLKEVFALDPSDINVESKNDLTVEDIDAEMDRLNISAIGEDDFDPSVRFNWKRKHNLI